jgi:hypothetical protein
VGCETAILLCGGPSLSTIDPDALGRRTEYIMAVNLEPVRRGLPMNAQVTADAPSNEQQDKKVNSYILKHTISIMRNDNIVKWRRDRFRSMCAWPYSPISQDEIRSVEFYRGLAGDMPTDFLHDEYVWFGELDDQSGPYSGIRCSMLPAFRILWEGGFRRVYLLGCDFGDRRRREYWKRLEAIFQALRPQFDRAGFEVFNATEKTFCTAFPLKDLP